MALLLGGCAGAGTTSPQLVEVYDTGHPEGAYEPATPGELGNEGEKPQGGFHPSTLVVPAGTEVRWHNKGARFHTVTTGNVDIAGEPAVPEGAVAWNSGPLWPGETFRQTLEVPGTYLYWCAEHLDEQMIGTIEVEEP